MKKVDNSSLGDWMWHGFPVPQIIIHPDNALTGGSYATPPNRKRVCAYCRSSRWVDVGRCDGCGATLTVIEVSR